uniref:BTB domain-containing protein n=1 Tax=Panagrolaimus sp. JU765 TaxID=591449 RepID=A0AC34QAW0_9BILA
MFHFPIVQQNNQNFNFEPAPVIVDPILDLENLKYHVERHPAQHGQFSFSVKFTNVSQRQVSRSLDYEDDAYPAAMWGIRCVPLGHHARFYLLRNSLLEYFEFEYDFTIVSGDGNYASGFGRRGFINANTIYSEFLDPPVDIPVNIQRNWFVIQVNIRHLRRDRDYWFIQPDIPTLRHPLIQAEPEPVMNVEEIHENAIVEAEIDAAAAVVATEKLRHLDEDVFEFPGFTKRLLTLFTEETLSDCEIHAGRAVIPAHKAVLAAHSIVFRSMFCHHCTLESRTSTVTIKKFLPEAVLVMIQWFYTGELVPLDNEVAYRYLPLSDIISNKSFLTFHPLDFIDPNFADSLRPNKPNYLDSEVVFDVVQLANKYALDDLEYLSEQMLVQRTDVSNCCRNLLLASMLQLFSLKITAVNMIRENKEKVLKSDEWKELVAADKELSEKILEQL